MTVNRNDYLLLAVFGMSYVGFVFRYQTQPKYTLFGTIVFAIAYLVWGLFHESRAHNFHLRVVLEYLLIAILGIVIISSLLL